jgi:tetratricopeptide (TPR) repeat protein
MNRVEEALSFARRAVDRDPLNPLPETLLGLNLALQGRVREGMGSLRHAYTLGSLPQPRLALWMFLAREEREDEALQEAAAYFAILGRVDIAQILTERVATSGYTGAMRKAAEALAAQRGTSYVQPTQIARLFLHAGDKRRSLEWLECAYRERDFFLVHLGWPEWDPLHSETAFGDLVSRVGLPK